MNFCGISDILLSKSDLKTLDGSDPPARVSLFPSLIQTQMLKSIYICIPKKIENPFSKANRVMINIFKQGEKNHS